jgi:lambda family phage tail tape measure protein
MANETTTLGIGVDSSGVRAATQDLQKFAETGNKAEQSTKDIEKALGAATLRAELAGRAIGEAISGLFRFGVQSIQAIDSAIKSVGNYQDLADKTNASAEGFAAIQQAADIAGVSIDSVAQSTVILSTRLAKNSSDSKDVGLALKNIGIEVEAFKKLDPTAQYQQIAVALDKYADSGNKTATVVAILGRGGAEQQKVLKELAQTQDQSVILTNQQIALADNYGAASDRLSSQLRRLGEVAALQAAPSFIAFKGAIADTFLSLLGIENKSTDLAKNKGIQDFAQAALRALASVIDFVQDVSRAFEKIGFGLYSLSRAAFEAVRGQFGVALDILKDVDVKSKEISSRPYFSDLFNARLANPAPTDAAQQRPELPKPFVTKPTKDGSDNTDAALLKARLDDIKQSLSAQTDAYKNSESIFDALRSAGLVREDAYYAQKRKFIELDSQAQVVALEKQNAILAADTSGKKADQINRTQQIADNTARIAIIQADAQAKITISNINQQASQDALTLSYRNAQAAANDYIATLQVQAQRSVEAVGQSDRQRQQAAGLNAIDDRFTQQRNQLESERRQGAFKDNEAGYQRQLDLLTQTKAREIEIYNGTFAKILAAQGDFSNGVRKSLQDYVDNTGTSAKSVGDVTSKAFKGAEDALVTFVTTGKLSFKSLADSILADLVRIAVQQQITQPLAKSLLGSTTGGAGGGDFLSSVVQLGLGLFSGGGYNGSTGGINGGSAVLPNSLRGGLADGGSFGRGELRPINERGPEILTVGSKSYLATGNEGGSVTPIGGSGGSRSITVMNNFTVGNSIDRRTQDQIAAFAGAGVKRATERNT